MKMYGPISAGDLLDCTLTMVRAAMEAVRSGDPTVAFKKPNLSGVPDADFATHADIAAQNACETIRLHKMSWAGAIGEEQGLRIPCTLPGRSDLFAYWTYDGCDESHHLNKLKELVEAGQPKGGVASMVAFVWDGTVVAAAVGDVFRGIISVLDPVDGKVYEYYLSNSLSRISLSALSRTVPLTEGTLLWRGNRAGYHPLVAGLVSKTNFPHQLRYQTHSFGAGMLRLWAGDLVTMHVQGGGGAYATTWDDTPVIAINWALGMVYLRPSADDTALEEFTPELVTGGPVERPISTVIVHKSRIGQLGQLVPVRMLAG